MASEAEIKKRIELLTEEAERLRQIYELDNRRTKSLKKSNEIVKEILKLEAQLSDEYKDITKSLAEAVKKEKLLRISGKDRLGLAQKANQSAQQALKSAQKLIEAGKISEDLAKDVPDRAQMKKDLKEYLKTCV